MLFYNTLLWLVNHTCYSVLLCYNVKDKRNDKDDTCTTSFVIATKYSKVRISSR